MSAPAQPVPTLSGILKQTTDGLSLNISGTLPGESMIVSIMNYASMVRATMAPDLTARLDKITVQQMEDLQSVWRSIWVAIGVLK